MPGTLGVSSYLGIRVNWILVIVVFMLGYPLFVVLAEYLMYLEGGLHDWLN